MWMDNQHRMAAAHIALTHCAAESRASICTFQPMQSTGRGGAKPDSLCAHVPATCTHAELCSSEMQHVDSRTLTHRICLSVTNDPSARGVHNMQMRTHYLSLKSGLKVRDQSQEADNRARCRAMCHEA